MITYSSTTLVNIRDGEDGINGTSQNLLLDVYASLLDKVKAPWDRYLSDASNTTITGEFIAEDNLPDPNATHFYRITDSSASTKSRGLCFYNGGTPPFLDGHTYRIGCWVRNHTGSPSISFYLGNVGSWTNRKIITNTNWEWIECVHTFGDTDPAINAQSSTYKRIYFYFGNNNVEGSSLDMCGFKVEEVQTNISTARNYLLKTEKLEGWGVTGGATISNGVATFPEVTANTWREFYPTKNFKYEIIRNKNIIFSVRVKADVGKICACNLCIGVDSTETAYTRQKYTNNFVYFTGTGEWQTICVAIPISDEIFTSGSGTPNYDNCWVTVRIGAVNSYHNSFQATQPQLSLGTTATAWSVAPEDVEASMQEKVDNIEIGGRNLLPFKDCSSETLTRGGITLTKEEDGWIRVSGTRSGTSLTTFTLWQNPDGDTYTAPINNNVPQDGNTNQFTLSVETEGTPFLMGTTYTNSSHIVAYGSTSSTSWRIGGMNGTSIIGVFPTYMSVIRYYIGVNSTGTVNGRFRIKLERGNKATDWTPAPEDVEQEISTLRTDLQSQIDEKIQTYYQSTNPASSWTTTELKTAHDGDLWYYTGTTTSTYIKDNVYRYNGSNNTWTVYSASGELFDKVDGKSTIFYGTTSGTYTGVETGDYLVDSTDGSSYRYDGSEWVKVTDYQGAIDAVEIGGRNLLLGSAQKIPVHWSTSAQNDGIFNVDTNVEVSEWRAKDAYRLYGQAGSTSRLFGLLYGIPFTSQLSIQNQSYTFSIFVKNQADVDFLIGTNSLGDYISIAPGESKRVVTTVIGNGSSNIQFTFSAATNGGSYDAILWHPKIEFGNKVTDWSPAPEDNLKGTNIEPFFSHDITDIYDPETNPNGYWMNNGTSYGWTKNPNFTFTQLEDGWLHVHIDNSSGTGTIRNDCCVNRYNPFIKRATKYTFLAEFRNNQSTGAALGSDFYLVQQSGSVQFWGQNVTTAPLVHLDGIGTVTIPIFDIPSDGRYTFSRFTKFSEPEGSSSHWTTNDMMSAFTFRANAGAVFDYDVRLSLYEGEYWGQYNPYVISDITSVRQSAEEANDKIDNLEIGGRNLLYNSATMPAVSSGDKGWRASGGTVTHVDLTDPPIYNITGAIRVTNTGSSTANIGIAQDKITNKFITGEKYSQSCWVRASETLRVYLSPIWIANDKCTGSSVGSLGYFSIGTEWTYIKWEGAVLQGEQVASYSAGYVYAYQAPVNSWLEICGMKLEKGNRATDWTPAPEDTQADIDTALAQSIWYATCSDAGATKSATIIPVTTNFVLNVGTTVNVKFNNTNTGAVGSLTLNINNTGAKNIKYIYNKTLNNLPAVDYIAAGSTYLFVYDGTYWVIQNMNYNTNETNHILNNFSGKTGELGIWQTGLFMKDGNGTYQNICTDSSGNITRTNANTKKANPNGFEVGSSVYLSTSGTTYAANANITGAVYASYGAFDSRYSLNTTLTANCLTPYQSVYLVGTINNGLYYLDTIWWTQTPNDSTKVYVLIGGCYDSTTTNCRITLYEQNNWYKYVDGVNGADGQLVDYTNRLAELAATTATSFIAVETDNHGIYVHPEDDMSTGWKIGDAIELFKGGLSYIKLWIENNIPKIRIGKSDQGHVLLDNNSVDIKNSNDVLASFGETAIIGKEDNVHLQIGSTGIYGQNSNNSNDRFFEISQNNGVETIESRQSISEDFSRNSTVTKQFTIKLSENKIDDKIKYSVIVFDKRTSLALYVISSREFSVSFLPKTIYISPDSGSYSGTITISEKDENNNLSGTMVLQQEDVDLSLECHLSISYSKLYTTPSFTFGSRIIDSKYGGYSTVNGLSNIASGNYSYAGGKETIAEGDSSFAMGTASEARENHSVAIGEHVIAKGNNQTVIGCYNEEDDESLFVIGNGEDLTLFQRRSNALTVDQTGNIFMYLDVSSTSSPSPNTTDGLLYSAITALGWETDIITTS